MDYSVVTWIIRYPFPEIRRI